MNIELTKLVGNWWWVYDDPHPHRRHTVISRSEQEAGEIFIEIKEYVYMDSLLGCDEGAVSN